MIEIIKASAGSGKTYTLAVKYITLLMKAEIEYLRHGKDWRKNVHRRTLAITFTNNSTNEMKQRIVKALAEIKGEDKQGYRKKVMEGIGEEVSVDRVKEVAGLLLEEMLEDWQMVRVSTIDSFFNQVVNAFIRELGIDQTPAVDLDTDNIVEQAVDNMLERLEETSPEGKALVRFLGSMMNESLGSGKRWNIRPELINIAKQTLTDTYRGTAGEKAPGTECVATFKKHLQGELRETEKQANAIWDEMREKMDGIEGVNTNCRNAITKHKTDSAAVAKAMEEPEKWFTKKNSAAAGDGEWLTEKMREVIAMTENARVRSIGALMEGMNYTGVIAELDQEVARVCRENDSILISSTNQLINEIVRCSSTPFIYEKTGLATDHYMIDEFQDTSEKQWENFVPLISESNSQGKESLVVGDVKQSIYRWRNGNWKILQEGIEKAFPGRCEEHPLNCNYRSLKGIVDFNNSLYLKIAEKYAGVFGKSLEMVYSNVKQGCNKEAEGGGKVRCMFAEGKKEEFQERAMRRIVRWFKQLREEGKLTKSAVLVRKNDEAQYVARMLAKAGIRFVSAESLLVGNDICVRYINAVMQYIASEDDLLARKRVMSLGRCITESSDIDEEMMGKLRWLPLDEMVMAIVRRYKMETMDDSAHRSFVFTFADILRGWMRNNDGNINRWLEYWKEKKESACVPLPEDDEAVKIMTIHKSKGLQFINVALLMNSTSWECGISRKHRKMISVGIPQEICTEGMERAFVNLNSKAMEGSEYDAEQKAEWEECCIDELNTLYVATTRAEREMLIVANRAKKDEIVRYKNFSIVGVLEKSLEGWGEGMIENEEEEETACEAEEVTAVREHGEKIEEMGPLPEMMNIRIPKSEEQEAGIEKHEWIAGIRYEDEVGDMNEEQSALWQRIKRFGWFKREWERVWNEAEIAYKGRTLRPDRVMFKGRDAVVVDWKFGQNRDKKYNRQVEEYCEALKVLGYNVSGWLYYAGEDDAEMVV